MQEFPVDDDLAALVERLAKAKPFENLSFNDALWRVIRTHVDPTVAPPTVDPLDELMDGVRRDMANGTKKAPSPSVAEWVASIPELKTRRGLTTWKAVCDLLKIDTGGDSARRKLLSWVSDNRPHWTPVPRLD